MFELRNVGVFLVLVMIGSGVFMYSQSAPVAYAEALTIARGVQSFEELSDRFRSLAHEKGGEYAFEVMRRAPLPPNTDVHLLGHAVGEILYEQKGVEGMASCTQDFRNACSHTIVVGALQDFGEGALSQIREACLKAPGGSGAYTMCYHGLGHGVLAHFQYSLPETIALCKKTGTPEYYDREYIECVGGAIMELMGGGGHNTEAWEAAREKYLTSPLAPCTSAFMHDDVREICFTYLTPHIWKSVGIDMGMPDPNLFDEAFAACAALTDTTLRDVCAGGFGKEFIPLAASRDVRAVTDLDAERMRDVVLWCGYAEIDDMINACIRDAVASLYWGGENDPNASLRFCSVADTEGRGAECYRHLIFNINRFSPHTRDSLCRRLPSDYHAECLSEAAPAEPSL